MDVIDVAVERSANGYVARVRVEQREATTEHRVTVIDDDLRRYGATDVADLV